MSETKNELEDLLEKAATEPAHRPAFFRTLLESTVWVPGTAGSVATDTLPGDEPIDICQVKKGEKGISHFITEHIAPFYERRWGGFLRDFKQNRII